MPASLLVLQIVLILVTVGLLSYPDPENLKTRLRASLVEHYSTEQPNTFTFLSDQFMINLKEN